MDKTSHAQLTQQAAAWLVALDGGTADTEDFERWRTDDPRHAAAFAEVTHAWQELDRLRPIRSEHVPSPPIISRRNLFRAAAATGVVGIASAAGFPFLNEASATTGIGERRVIKLPDGTRIELNTRTRVRWPRLLGHRKLWLDQGEIAIDVVPGDSPFTLIAVKTVSLDSGQYNVRADADVVTLLPLRGQAVVGGKPVGVGHMGSITRSGAAVAVADGDARERSTGWQRGEIIFDGETIADAAAEYNRYLERPIIVADPDLARQRLGGRFQSGDPMPFLQALADGFGARVTDTGQGPIIISSRQKKSGDG